MATASNKQCDKALLELLTNEDEKCLMNEKFNRTNLQIKEKTQDSQKKKNCREYKLETSEEMDKVLNNLDIIRLRRLIKRQAVQNATLSFHVDAADKEATELRRAMEKLQSEFEDLTKQMTEEKQKHDSLQSLKIELNSLRHSNKMLSEEIRDIKEEKNTLKLTNEKLLVELDVIKASEPIS